MLFKLTEHGYKLNIKETLHMVMTYDGNSNIFQLFFFLVEGETISGWSFFLKNLRMHLTLQVYLCLIT